ncbi:MAG TPA: iron ABC transporter permease [Methanosarcinales archaeon]|nr:iron ABC transporter permease [Methanosarcinales archaeon]
MSARRKVLFIFSLLFIIIIMAVVSISLGAANITIWDVCSAILNKFFPDHFNPSEFAEFVVWQMRIPRILMAILAGIGLAVAGTIFQSTFRNSLASPYTLGVLSAAAFGTSLATVLGIERSMVNLPIAIMMSTFVALLPAFFIYRFVKRKASPEAAILIGIAFLFLFSILTPMLLLFTEAGVAKESMFWMSGGLDRASWTEIGIVFFTLLFCIPLLLLKSRDFDMIADTKYITKEEKTRNAGIFIASLMSAVIVCFTGIIGFVGLVAPCTTKTIIGGEHRFLIPASGLLGGVLLLGLDALARTIITPVILPVGFLTSLIGIPLFIYLITRIVIRSEHR